MKTIEERFWEKVDKTGDCWEWKGWKKSSGYGMFHMNGNDVKAHRAVIGIEGSDIPSGMCVCHTCDNPGCVNPDHLFLGTHLDNMRDMNSKGRRECAKGESNGNAELCKVDIHLIRDLHSGGCSQASIAGWIGISKSHMNRIIRRQSWAHI